MRNSFIVMERVLPAVAEENDSVSGSGKKGKSKAVVDRTVTFQHHSNKLFQNADGTPRHFTSELEIMTVIQDARVNNVDLQLLKKANDMVTAGDNEKALALIAAAQGELTGEVIIINVIDL